MSLSQQLSWYFPVQAGLEIQYYSHLEAFLLKTSVDMHIRLSDCLSVCVVTNLPGCMFICFFCRSYVYLSV